MFRAGKVSSFSAPFQVWNVDQMDSSFPCCNIIVRWDRDLGTQTFLVWVCVCLFHISTFFPIPKGRIMFVYYYTFIYIWSHSGIICNVGLTIIEKKI